MALDIEYITNHTWPSVDASAVVTTELASGLARKGHKVFVLLPNPSDEYLSPETGLPSSIPPTCTIVRWGPRLPKTLATSIGFIILLYKTIPAAFKSNMILSHYHFMDFATLCAAVTSKLTRRPLVVRVDDLIPGPPDGVISHLLMNVYKMLTLWSFRQARLILVPGDELVAVACKMYGLMKTRVEVCYNGVDTRMFSPRNRSKDLRESLGSRHILVFCSIIDKRRSSDLLVLLKAVRVLKKEIHDLKTLIIGYGPSFARVSKLEHSAAFKGSVKFLESVSTRSLVSYLASADVGIGPLIGSTETQGAHPFKVLQYMASGACVILGRDTVSNRLIREGFNGLYVKSGDPLDLARILRKILLDDKLAARIRSGARTTVLRTYTWEHIVSNLEPRLIDVVRDGGSSL